MRKCIVWLAAGLAGLVTSLAQAGSAPVLSGQAAGNAERNYNQHCGECHLAFQAWLLPARSWQRIMSDLQRHFGEALELDSASTQMIGRYLAEHAADRSPIRFARRIMQSLPPREAPLRITELSYFRRLHHEVPLHRVVNNPKVVSFSNCAACHPKAAAGDFGEDSVWVPGMSRHRGSTRNE